METANLIQRCREGESEAYRDLLVQYEKRVFRLALSLLNDPAEAEEVTQDAFLAAFKGLDSYRGEAPFSTWISGIAVNLCRKRLRKRQSRERLAGTLEGLFRLKSQGSEPTEERVIRNETGRTLLSALDHLDENHRLPLVIYYYNGLSTAEIAQVLDNPLGTVLSRMYTARERLRVALKELDGCPPGKIL